uniref:PDZ domain-containing protein n=1 Tax=Ningiella ruwaisensis TaxID=2364274 RepID=UPI0010A00C06|nr:PDZ domain-containing protein [Ningiella ruwaisensis]
MKENVSTVILLLCLMAAVIYSVMSLNEDETTYLSSAEDDVGARNLSQARQAPANYATTNSTFSAGKQSAQYNNVPATEGVSSHISLPIFVKMIGSQLRPQTIALLEHKGMADQFEPGDLIFGYDIQVLDIQERSVLLGFDNNTFEISLTGPNLLAQPELETYEDFLAMTPDEIGTRPRILEHIVHLTHTNFIANGMIASPGMNPELFEQAGLQEDDVITSINGKRVTVPGELEELSKTIRHANTLVFQVMRKGRLITLYLDIPGESLNVTRD